MASPFTSSITLGGESFSHGLSAFNPTTNNSGEFVEDTELALFCDEKGRANFAKQMILWETTDPITTTEVPTFSKESKFIEGMRRALSADGVPMGTVVLYDSLLTLPSGWVVCNGKAYTFPGREAEVWVTPALDSPAGTNLVWIQKLPPGAREASILELINRGPV